MIHNKNSRLKIFTFAKLRDFLLLFLMNGQDRSVENTPNCNTGIPLGMQPKHKSKN